MLLLLLLLLLLLRGRLLVGRPPALRLPRLPLLPLRLVLLGPPQYLLQQLLLGLQEKRQTAR